MAVHGKALLDADGMRRQNRPIPVDVASRDTVAHDEENIMIVKSVISSSCLISRFRFVSSHAKNSSRLNIIGCLLFATCPVASCLWL